MSLSNPICKNWENFHDFVSKRKWTHLKILCQLDKTICNRLGISFLPTNELFLQIIIPDNNNLSSAYSLLHRTILTTYIYQINNSFERLHCSSKSMELETKSLGSNPWVLCLLLIGLGVRRLNSLNFSLFLLKQRPCISQKAWWGFKKTVWLKKIYNCKTLHNWTSVLRYLYATVGCSSVKQFSMAPHCLTNKVRFLSLA